MIANQIDQYIFFLKRSTSCVCFDSIQSKDTGEEHEQNESSPSGQQVRNEKNKTMRSVEEVLKNHFGPAKIMDESTDVAAAAASKNKSNGAEASGENRAATLAAAEALASFPTSAASVSTPSGGRSSRDQPPLLFPPAAGSTSASPAWMMKGGISGLKQTVASATKKKTVKYVKDPRAPKRFKSAFIFFTMHRHKTIRKEIEEKEGGPGNGERVSGAAGSLYYLYL